MDETQQLAGLEQVIVGLRAPAVLALAHHEGLGQEVAAGTHGAVGPNLDLLAAKLTLDGGAQTFQFGVTPSSKLLPGQSASSTEIVLGNVPFSGDEVYPLAVSGTFDDGQAFSFQAHVQIEQVP